MTATRGRLLLAARARDDHARLRAARTAAGRADLTLAAALLEVLRLDDNLIAVVILRALGLRVCLIVWQQLVIHIATLIRVPLTFGSPTRLMHHELRAEICHRIRHTRILKGFLHVVIAQ